MPDTQPPNPSPEQVLATARQSYESGKGDSDAATLEAKLKTVGLGLEALDRHGKGTADQIRCKIDAAVKEHALNTVRSQFEHLRGEAWPRREEVLADMKALMKKHNFTANDLLTFDERSRAMHDNGLGARQLAALEKRLNLSAANREWSAMLGEGEHVFMSQHHAQLAGQFLRKENVTPDTNGDGIDSPKEINEAILDLKKRGIITTTIVDMDQDTNVAEVRIPATNRFPKPRKRPGPDPS